MRPTCTASRPRRPRVTPSGVLLPLLLGLGGACASPAAPMDAPAAPPPASFEPGMLFPGDRSLRRPEDGVALPDGRLIVGDQVDGLRLIEPDGRSRPFGDLPGAGYAHDPPRRHGAANGMSLEPDGRHLLVADILGGAIYRVEVATGATRRVYDHPHGVNNLVRDSSGAIWFTQSARNTEAQGEQGMFTPVDVPVEEGALWRLPFVDGAFAGSAELVADGLRYANGVAVDEARGELYLCELAANRIWAFPLDVASGALGPGRTLLEMTTPDNLELDAEGRLWVVSPIRNEVLVVDPDTGEARAVFRQLTPAQAELAEEWNRRGEAGEPRLELLSPELHNPLPGHLTGVILGAPDGAVYLTGLGDALVRVPVGG